MIVGVLIVELYTDTTHSLKEKRHIISSIKEKLKNKYNISIIESDYQNLWQKIQLGISMVANSKPIIETSFTRIEDFITLNYPVRIVSVDKDFF